MKKQIESANIKYLVSNKQDTSWGLVVNTVGYQRIDKGASYPSTNHPRRYIFSTERGRVLDEYQLIYIPEGKGIFESDSMKQHAEIRQGNIFLLFPGERHSYKPLKDIGWYEYWIGFNGANIDSRVSKGFFRKEYPVFNVGVNSEIINLYKLAAKVAQKQETGFQQMLAGVVNLLLGYTYTENKILSFAELDLTNKINQAKIFIENNFNSDISPKDVAINVNMSYSWFRRVFKDYTGFSPIRYIQELRIQKSKELLTNTDKSSKDIAYEVGFDTPYYFSIIFKRHTGVSPIEYRNFTQGR